MKRQIGKFFGGLLVVVLGAGCMLVASYMHGPDLDLHFTREVRSELSPEWIGRNLASTLRWPQWFYSLAEARPSQGTELKKGSIIRFLVDPKKVQWKQFNLQVQVVEYIPNKLLRLRVLDDSSKRLTRLFAYLDWNIELIPDSKGTLIRGTALARTQDWRARLFGRLTERIVMNQVFYPNLLKLATLRRPFSVEPNMAPPRLLWDVNVLFWLEISGLIHRPLCTGFLVIRLIIKTNVP